GLVLRLRKRRRLSLTGHDRARRILRHALEHLAGKEDDSGLENGKQQRKEYWRDQRELDGGRAAAVAAKPVQCFFCRDEGLRHRENPRTTGNTSRVTRN